VTTPPPALRTAYHPILALRTAYRHFWPRVLRTVKQQKNHFWRLHLHNRRQNDSMFHAHVQSNVSFDVFACYTSYFRPPITNV